jgi:cyanate permease
MAADYFGTRYFGTINGTMQFLSTTGGAAGPWVVGRVVDLEGDYTLGWVIAAIVVAVVGVPAALASTAPSKLTAQHRPAPRVAAS